MYVVALVIVTIPNPFNEQVPEPEIVCVVLISENPSDNVVYPADGD